MNISELFLNSSLADLKRGYSEESEYLLCLLCGARIEKGLVYRAGDVLYEAEKYIQLHIKNSHGSVFEYLLGLDKKMTGLSGHQNSLLRLFYQGKSDAEIQDALQIGSSSTIRNHRYILREKERQARLFLVLMELLRSASLPKENHLKSANSSESAKIVSSPAEKYQVSDEERKKILQKYFPQGPEGPLANFNIREKSRFVVVQQLRQRFEKNRFYSEKEVNEILEKAYKDYVTLRRYLIEYGFLARRPDGSRYWLPDEEAGGRTVNMERRKELKQQYKEVKPEAGVYQIRNNLNQKAYVAATTNLKTMNGKLFQLQMGSHMNKRLQEEWLQYGEEAFVFEILEVLEDKKEGYFDRKEELKKLEDKWLEKLQPYGERGYN
jgi:DNA-binding CsgD family transcriptional regulator